MRCWGMCVGLAVVVALGGWEALPAAAVVLVASLLVAAVTSGLPPAAGLGGVHGAGCVQAFRPRAVPGVAVLAVTARVRC